jgi:uncharacterized membrane protein (DUF373 family)
VDARRRQKLVTRTAVADLLPSVFGSACRWDLLGTITRNLAVAHHTLDLVESHLVNPADSQVFQGLFGMVLTVHIGLEFKRTLLVVRHHRRAVVRVRSVILVALLALVRRFIILDLYQTTPSIIAALGGAALALGIAFWLVSNREEPQEVGLQE